MLPRDYVMSYYWYTLALKAGDPVAAKERAEVAKGMPDYEVHRALQLMNSSKTGELFGHAMDAPGGPEGR